MGADIIYIQKPFIKKKISNIIALIYINQAKKEKTRKYLLQSEKI